VARQDGDRRLQVFLAQARGPARNAALARSLANMAIRIKAQREYPEKTLKLDDPIIETLVFVTTALEQAKIDYAITGSLASSVHGEAKSTAGADLIILATGRQASMLAAKLSPRFYAPDDMLRNAVDTHGFVNVIDNATSTKVDLSFVAPNGFLAECVRRRVRATFGTGTPEFWFVTAEDIILMKLLWRKDTRSTKQWDNALSVAKVKGARMDWKYLFDHAGKLSIEDDLIKLRNEAGI